MRPLTLIRFFSPEKIHSPVAALNGAANHEAHQPRADAVALPSQITPTLIVVDSVAEREAVPGRRRRAVQIQRDEPQLAPFRQPGGKAAVQSVPRGITQGSSAPPAKAVQAPQVVPALLDAFLPIVREHGVVLSVELPLLAADCVAPVRGQAGQ